MNLNERVAIEVMGWTIKSDPPNFAPDFYYSKDGMCLYETFKWSPTTDGNDMLRVIERMRDEGSHIQITNLDKPTCTVYREPDPYMDEREGLCVAIKDAATLPEAVCLAALEAVKDE